MEEGTASGEREREPWVGDSHNLTILLFGRRMGIWKDFGTRQALLYISALTHLTMWIRASCLASVRLFSHL